jgi:hypothetical protein
MIINRRADDAINDTSMHSLAPNIEKKLRVSINYKNQKHHMNIHHKLYYILIKFNSTSVIFLFSSFDFVKERNN